MDELIEAQAVELDEDARFALIQEIQEIYAEDLPFFPLIYVNDVQAHNAERFTGILEHPGLGTIRWGNFQSFINMEPLTDQRVFRSSNTHDGNSTNPFVADGGVFNTETMRWVYDTLARFTTDLELEPWAAESWEWIDDSTLDVTLRDDMVFHDGTPVTADDLTFTIQYALDNEFPQFATVLGMIDSVETVDEYTTRFSLPQPSATFLTTVLPFVFIAPEHIWADVDDPFGFANPDPIGSGPWTFGEWRPNESWSWFANEDHFNPPNVDVIAAVLPEAESYISQVQLGELDGTGTSLRGDEMIEAFDDYPEIEVIKVPTISPFVMFPNLERLPTSDRAFREALHHAIPRDTFVDVIAGRGGGGVAHYTWLHPDDPFHNPNLPTVEFDLDQARTILEDAGYTWDDQGRLRYPADLAD